MPLKAIVCAIAVLALSAQATLDSRVDQAAARLKPDVPGLAVTVVIDGKVAYAKGFGSAAPTAGRPITPDTQFRTASVSKPITAAAVFRLVEQSRVSLDRPARDYCKALAALDGAPTVRHFLQHQSGMRHTSDAEDESIVGEFPRLEPALSRIVRERLRFSPGRRTLYTSWGYAVLGCVIESVSSQSYADFVKTQVFGPAQMRDTTFDSPHHSSPTFTPGFLVQGRAFRPSEIVDTRFKTPASGVISTTNDLARFATALFDRKLLPEALFSEMIAARKAPDDENAIFTAGWTIGPSNLGTPGFNYNGSMEGTTAVLAVLPERRIAVALLANRERFVRGVMPVVREALRAAVGLPSE
jgi:CubicO group peptidase (beta-lactamase class C family)